MNAGPPLTRVAQLAALIEQDIRRRGLAVGDSYLIANDVAALLGVHLRMASRAMELLGKRRVLVRRRGVGTFVGPAMPRPSAPPLKIIHVLVTPSRFNSGLETDALITGLRKQIPGCDVQFNFLPNEQPLEYVRQIVDREASVGALHGLIVLGCPRPVHEYVLEKKLPAVVFGGVYPTAANLPSVDVDQHAIGFHAAHWLLNQGHRRIALLAREVWLPGDNRLVDGVNEAMAAARLSQGALVIRSVPLDGPAIGMEIVQLMQEADPPTAFICRSPRFVPVVRRTFELLHMTRPPQIIVDRTTETITQPGDLPCLTAEQGFAEQVEVVGKMLAAVIDHEKLKELHVTLPVRLLEPRLD